MDVDDLEKYWWAKNGTLGRGAPTWDVTKGAGIPLSNAERRARWRAAHPERNAQIHYLANLRRQLRLVGISEDDYVRLLEESNSTCSICGRPEMEIGYRLAIDHDHETGRFRGLLCHQCNRAIGNLQDDPALLRKAAEYIEAARVVQ